MFKLQESLCSASNDGPLPQAGTTPVAVEQGGENISLESCLPHSPLSSEYSDISSLSSLSKEKEYSLSLSPSHHEQTQDHANLSWDDATDDTTSLTKQQKAFLRYLMRHGLMNEGFEEGHVPEQYRFKG
jgi:hypothetical protein